MGLTMKEKQAVPQEYKTRYRSEETATRLPLATKQLCLPLA
jgi:hypothetical protein